MVGSVAEAGMWPSALSNYQLGILDANQYQFWLYTVPNVGFIKGPMPISSIV